MCRRQRVLGLLLTSTNLLMAGTSALRKLLQKLQLQKSYEILSLLQNTLLSCHQTPPIKISTLSTCPEIALVKAQMMLQQLQQSHQAIILELAMDRRHKLLVSSTNVRSLRCLDRISRRLAMILAPSVQHKISIELQTLSQFTEASLNKGSCKIMRTKKPIDREIKWASLANKLQQLHRQNWPCNRSALSRTRQAARSSTKAA